MTLCPGLRALLATAASLLLASHGMAAQGGRVDTPNGPNASPPASAQGLCKDGTYTDRATSTGACRHHKGLQTWYFKTNFPSVTTAGLTSGVAGLNVPTPAAQLPGMPTTDSAHPLPGLPPPASRAVIAVVPAPK